MIFLLLLKYTINYMQIIATIQEREKDLTVYLQHMFHFDGTFEIQIMNTGKIVHNPTEYVDALLEAEAMQNV